MNAFTETLTAGLKVNCFKYINNAITKGGRIYYFKFGE